MLVYRATVLDGIKIFQEKAFLPIVQVPFLNFNIVGVNVMTHCFGVVPNNYCA